MIRVSALLVLAASVGLSIFASSRPAGPGRAGLDPHPRNARLSAEGSGEDDPGKTPSDWFYRQRAYPYPRIPEPARRDAFRRAGQMRTEFALRAQAALLGSESSRLGAQANGLGTWEPAGPTNIGGRVTAVAARSAAPDTVYLGSAAGGVFRSVDGGVNWTPIFDHVGAMAIGALAVDPTHGNTLYVGTGEANAAGDTYSGDGVWRTSDGGNTWEHLGLTETAKIAHILIDPADPSRIFVAAMGHLHGTNPERGLYRSLDDGQSWNRVLFVNDTTGVVDVALNPLDPDELYAAAWQRLRSPGDRIVGGYGSGIYKSADGGDTWTLLGPANGLPAPAPNIGRIGIAVCASVPSTVYAVYVDDDPGYFLGVYKSIDSGATWTRVNDGALSNVVADFGWYFGQIRVDPTDPDRVFVLGVTVMASSSGGSSWSEVGSGTHADHHALWISDLDPNRMYMGTDGGFYGSTSGGSSWTKSGNLPITQFYDITVDPQLPYRIYGGAQDNSTPGTTTGLIDDWDTYNYGDGFYTLVDPGNSKVIYAESQYGHLVKSTNGGNSFRVTRDGIATQDRRNWSTPFVMDPNNPDVLYYGTYRVYKTMDAAANWTLVSGDLTDGEDPGILEFGTITTIAVAASAPQTIVAGTDDANVWVTFNGGTSWSDISGGLPDRWITRVAVDPTDNMRLYVTLSGFHQDEYLPHVFTSDNGGGTWTDISSNLPEIPLNDLIVDPDNPNWIYVASDMGIFWTVNRGASWQPLGLGFPDAPVHSIYLHQPTRKLVAGTHGRSAYTYDLGTPTAVGEHEVSLSLPVSVSPNPTLGAATLRFDLEQGGRVTAEVFDVRGALMARVADGEFPPGSVTLRWDGTDGFGRKVGAGTYFYRVRTAHASRVGKIVVVR